MSLAVRVGRALLLLALVMVGTVVLMRMAPGYASDAAELDAQRGEGARSRMEADARGSWFQQDFGVSRQFGLPVWELVRPRLGATAGLLMRGVGLGWGVAFGAGLVRRLSRRRAARLLGLPFVLLLAVPVGALATLCLQLECGGPVLVLTLMVAARDYRFVDGLLADALGAPCLLQARAQGLAMRRVVRVHVLPAVAPQMGALAVMSVVTALSAVVPVEVLFDSPGIGQLAWAAAMNRDLPVLLAVTLVLAAMVALLSALSGYERMPELA